MHAPRAATLSVQQNVTLTLGTACKSFWLSGTMPSFVAKCEPNACGGVPLLENDFLLLGMFHLLQLQMGLSTYIIDAPAALHTLWLLVQLTPKGLVLSFASVN